MARRVSMKDRAAQRAEERAQERAQAEVIEVPTTQLTRRPPTRRPPTKPPKETRSVSFTAPWGFRDYCRAAMLWDLEREETAPNTLNVWIENAIRAYIAATDAERAAVRRDLEPAIAAGIATGETKLAVLKIDAAVRDELDDFLAQQATDDGTKPPLGSTVYDAMLMALRATYAASDATLAPAEVDKYERGITKKRAGKAGVSFTATADFMDLVRGAYMAAVASPNPPASFADWVDRAILAHTQGDAATFAAHAAPLLAEENARRAAGEVPTPRRVNLSEFTHSEMLSAVKKRQARGETRSSLALTALAAATEKARRAAGGTLTPYAANQIVKHPVP